MPTNPLLQLCDLLESLFQSAELERFIYLEMDKGLLPVGVTSFEGFVFLIARACEQRGFLSRKGFWDALVRQRPLRAREIRRIQNLFTPPDDDPPSPPRPSGKALPWLPVFCTTLRLRGGMSPARGGPVEATAAG